MIGKDGALAAGYHRFVYAVHRAKEARDPHWHVFRSIFLAKNDHCISCGTKEHLEPHHLIPVHVDKARELDETNLRTFCMTKGRLCHLRIAHAGDFRGWNPNAERDAAAVRNDPQLRHVIEARSIMARVYQ